MMTPCWQMTTARQPWAQCSRGSRPLGGGTSLPSDSQRLREDASRAGHCTGSHHRVCAALAPPLRASQRLVPPSARHGRARKARPLGQHQKRPALWQVRPACEGVAASLRARSGEMDFGCAGNWSLASGHFAPSSCRLSWPVILPGHSRAWTWVETTVGRVSLPASECYDVCPCHWCSSGIRGLGRGWKPR